MLPIQTLFRDSFSKIASQAMILTPSIVLKNTVSYKPESFRGVTLGSVTSLTIKPKPMLQFNLQVPSYTSQELHQSHFFAVHVMPPDEKSIVLARLFSKGAHKDGDIVTPAQPFSILEKQDYQTLEVRRHGKDIIVPILKHAERVFLCETKKCFKVSDHEIWIGEVEDVIVHKDVKSGGLLHFDRNFYNLGGKV